MISNILKLIGVISVALIIGYIAGTRQVSNHGGGSTAQSVAESTESERSTTTTVEVSKPDGSKTITTVTDNTKNTNRKEDTKVPSILPERPRQFRTTVAVRPEWDDEKKSVKVHPMVVISKRLWDSPAWADIIVDPGRKEMALGVSLEW
jgi:hypothetical protein